jgi:hypothetical protein
MEDITPLNLEDQPKLFGLRYDQLIVILGCLILSTQIYSWLSPIPFAGQDLRLDFSILVFMIGPLYCLLTMHETQSRWGNLINYYFASQIYIPGPDPNPTRFLVDEELLEFCE